MKSRIHLALLLCALVWTPLGAAGDLNIFFIDVEGGQATLILTPSGQSLLVDAGYADPKGRDPRRILAAAKDAGVAKIDYLFITHFHADHIGGVAELQKLIDIGAVIDHENITGSDVTVVKPFESYASARKRIKQHIVAKLGDRLPLADVETVIVSNKGDTLKQPLPGAGEPNATCGPNAQAPHDVVENPRSTGFWLRFGQFRFLDLGDLTGKPLHALACPNDMIGPIDLYLVPHHGNDDVTDPAVYAAFKPRVLVVNNGGEKGGGNDFLKALRKMDGIDGYWLLHRPAGRGAEKFPEAQIANRDNSTAHWIKVTAKEDGSFTVINGRTGAGKSYPSASARTAKH